MYDQKALKIITKDFFLQNRGIKFNEIRLAGIESSSVPMLISFSQEAYRYGVNLDIVSVRKKPKNAGFLHTVEGKVDYRPVMVIDDVIGPGHIKYGKKWCAYTVDALQRSGIPVLDSMYAIINKQSGNDGTVTMTDDTFKLKSMFTLDDFAMTYEEYHGRKKLD